MPNSGGFFFFFNTKTVVPHRFVVLIYLELRDMWHGTVRIIWNHKHFVFIIPYHLMTHLWLLSFSRSHLFDWIFQVQM